MILGTLTTGPAGFAELRRAVSGISDSVLAERLAELVKAGLLERQVHEGPPITVAYALSTAGQGLLPAMQALTEWAATSLRC